MSRKTGTDQGPDRSPATPPGATRGGGPPLRPKSAPAPGPFSICPHCWYVNRYASRLCGRCGADMATALQESGGARRTAPVQSPVPVHGMRLSRFQRVVVLGFLALLALGQFMGAFAVRPAPHTTSAARPRSGPAAGVNAR